MEKSLEGCGCRPAIHHIHLAVETPVANKMTGGRTDGERVEDAEGFFFRSDQDGQS